jgi:hypothetical protein
MHASQHLGYISTLETMQQIERTGKFNCAQIHRLDDYFRRRLLACSRCHFSMSAATLTPNLN